MGGGGKRRRGGWWGETSGIGGSGKNVPSIPPPTWAPGSLQGSWVRSSALQGPLCHVGPRGVGGREEEGRGREADGVGSLWNQRIRGSIAGVSLTLSLCPLGPPPPAAWVLGV